jgi:YtfJ family uncharacterized protein
MAFKSIITLVLLALHMPAALSQAPQLEHPLPALTIEDRGEILLQGNDFTYDSWSSETSPNGVHVLQYLAATRTASKLFEPLTDGLQASFDRNDYHVTTIINLDAAMWGTTGFVVSEIEKNKRMHPDSTLVLDADGAGAKHWQLGEEGAGIIIMDTEGIVRYFTRSALSEAELANVLDLVRDQIESCTSVC